MTYLVGYPSYLFILFLGIPFTNIFSIRVADFIETLSSTNSLVSHTYVLATLDTWKD